MARARRRRYEPFVDAPPEYYPYKDTGCDAYPSCLACPLPRCKYDDPGWLQRERRLLRDRALLSLHGANGRSVEELARDFGISERTVFRIISRHRNGRRGAKIRRATNPR